MQTKMSDVKCVSQWSTVFSLHEHLVHREEVCKQRSDEQSGKLQQESRTAKGHGHSRSGGCMMRCVMHVVLEM